MATEQSSSPRNETPRLLLFGVTKLSDMIAKGNLRYVDGYRSYFGSVDVAYLVGHSQSQVSQAGTHLVSLGSGNMAIDLILAPVNLYRFARKNPADVYLTADQVFSWWTALLIRWLLGARVVLMPVALPEQLYVDHDVSLSGLPVWVEKIMLRLSFASASVVHTAHAFGAFVEIFRAHPYSRDKVFITDGLVEALPGPEFEAARLLLRDRDRRHLATPIRLIYVGRLHPEKLVEDLIEMMQRMQAKCGDRSVRLRLIGDGPDRTRLEALATSLGVDSSVDFVGSKSNGDIPEELFAADMIVSPLTGTSLREAALCGLPIVAYERDWIVGVLKNNETALLVPSRDVGGLSDAVLRLIADDGLRVKLSQNVKVLGETLWTIEGARRAMSELHAAVARTK